MKMNIEIHGLGENPGKAFDKIRELRELFKGKEYQNDCIITVIPSLVSVEDFTRSEFFRVYALPYEDKLPEMLIELQKFNLRIEVIHCALLFDAK